MIPTTGLGVLTGQTVVMSFLAFGTPMPILRWERPGDMVLTNSAHTQVYQSTLADGGFTFVKSTLEICNTVVSDSGSYNIAAENSFGTQYASFQFIVQTERKDIHVQCYSTVRLIHACAVSDVLCMYIIC